MPRLAKGEMPSNAAVPNYFVKHQERFDALVEKVAYLEKQIEELQEVRSELRKQRTGSTIQRVETFNGEIVPEKEENEWGTTEQKIQCMMNAAKILPPNYIVNGRHLLKNIEAICPFPVTEDLMDELYSQFSHEVEA